jgi:hypothetical protein
MRLTYYQPYWHSSSARLPTHQLTVVLLPTWPEANDQMYRCTKACASRHVARNDLKCQPGMSCWWLMLLLLLLLFKPVLKPKP